jgi:hypothetical protein
VVVCQILKKELGSGPELIDMEDLLSKRVMGKRITY